MKTINLFYQKNTKLALKLIKILFIYFKIKTIKITTSDIISSNDYSLIQYKIKKQDLDLAFFVDMIKKIFNLYVYNQPISLKQH